MAEAAVGKRIKISKIQQQIMLAVLGASLVFGVSLVFSIYFIKYIAFNTKVIDAKEESIKNYYKTINNVGICTTKNKDGKFSDKELKDCVPENIDVEEIPNTLRYNVLLGMANNTDLESVAREGQESCYNPNTGKKIDWAKRYRKSETDKEREENFYMLKMCSSLRAIPDALPSQNNTLALLASMNQIFLISDFQPEALSPSSSAMSSPIIDLEVIPISVSVKSDVATTTRLLQNLEKSIRSFSFQSASISWNGEVDGRPMLELHGMALAFYTNEITATEKTKTIYASKEAKKSVTTTSSSLKTADDIVAEKGENE